MSRFKGENYPKQRDELLDGPQPGFHRYTQEELDEMEAKDKAHFDQLAENLGGDEDGDRDIGTNIILGQD